ncbi:cysteine methyltransferase [Photobacterium ganghwense]|uniref:Methylated-DNA--protein-cysteine methyltransferase n=1 Tax=Photobacterium ganghwense TaxID=320778 RepID=A0A0J1K6H1_9GAMM|nr:methylated-DNA--[protein]-cysteine S-methyltransferase [Photobacterium ganghwense]KLV09952.1 cysteine methyltransferase [Photobacterium ganghwense]PSU09199.1 cysteine methyltransferase [Photobacterium ganghwense]QSV16392.1 methylated-DNA--[protein]-cysteine S-methyltransferase [Photobacterium ganghwense]
MSNQLIETPIGMLNVVADEHGVKAIEFAAAPDTLQQPSDVTRHCCQQLAEYFAGERQTFEVPLNMAGTEFQHQVWQALDTVKFGETCSYGDIARSIGNPKAVRAVGAANGKNPVPIIVPCHRIIGSSGKLTGYAGGLDIKVWLLTHEDPSRA